MTSDRKAADTERERRRADALRANLRRRKAQSRERDAPPVAEDDPHTEDPA